MRVPTGYIKQAEIATGTDAVAKEMAPDVVRIRYAIGEDWSGDPSIQFRVVLSDAASRGKNLFKIADRVRHRLEENVRPDEMGLIAYFNFRSKTEQDSLKEPAWM